MSCSPSSRTIVCKEVFDENSLPSEEEIKDYAVKIGINPETEPHLLHFARDGLMQALPPGWKPCYDEELQSWYYFNFKSGTSQWEHPLDDVYRNLVRKVRSESISSAGEEDSKTSAKEDLKSYEEAAPATPETMQSAPPSLENIKGSGILRKANIQLAPLKKSPSRLESVTSPLATTPSSASSRKLQPSPTASSQLSKTSSAAQESSKISKSREISSSSKNSTGVTETSSKPEPRPTGILIRESQMQKDVLSPTARIDINRMDVASLLKKNEDATSLSKKERLLSAQEKHPRGMTGRGELTLTGGGSMFLKSKQQQQQQQKTDSPSTTSPSPVSGVSPSVGDVAPVVEVISTKEPEETLPKSILRGDQRSSSAGKPLWDIDPREMSSEEKQMWRRQELEEERKSVRFNLEQDLDIRFNLSDLSDQEGEEEEEEEEDEEDEAEDEEEEEEKDWNSDEEDLDEERVIAGIKVSDILNLMDASDLEEASIGEDGEKNKFSFSSKKTKDLNAVNAVKPMSKSVLRPGEKSVGGTRFTVERVHEPEGKGVSVLYPSKEPQLQKTPTEKEKEIKIAELSDVPVIDTPNEPPSEPSSDDKDVKEEESANDKVGGESVKDLSLGLSENNGVLGREVGISETEICKVGEEAEPAVRAKEMAVNEAEEQHKLQIQKELQRLENEYAETLSRHREEWARKLEEARKDLEDKQQNSLEALRIELAKKEEEEKSRLQTAFQEKLAAFETELKLQHEAQEKSIRENMESSLQELRDTLAAEREVQIEALRLEQEALRAKQLAEFEEEQISNRARLEQETAHQLEAIQSELAAKLDAEQAEIKKAHKEQLDQITAANNAEIKETELRLAEELEARKKELQESHEKEMQTLGEQLQEALNEEEAAKDAELEASKKRNDALEQLRKDAELDLEQKKKDILVEHEAVLTELKAEHAVNLEKMKLDFRIEEEQIRREHAERLDELRSRMHREVEAERQRLIKANDQHSDSARQELIESSRVFEKLRCEKRLLEDKYRSLKEKYIRLKTDVKISMERRKRRDGGGTTTGSETERSTSHKAAATGAPSDSRGRQQGSDVGSAGDKQRNSRKRLTSAEMPSSLPPDRNKTTSAIRDPSPHKSINLKSTHSPAQLHQEQAKALAEDSVDSDNISSSVSSQPIKVSKHLETAESHNVNNRRRRQLFGRLKSASTSRLLLNNNNNNNSSGVNNNGNSHTDVGTTQGDDSALSPVENLRRQLQKLEDLEDQFPASTHTDTYLRYPFTTDSGQLGSSELEFFRHRIHLERDSVRRAKDFLRAQRNSFQLRQRELKQRQLEGNNSARNMLDQLYQEERELTDMEVSLHRTRSLLGEKIIRLRHLEQSLHRASSPRPKSRDNKEDTTLSDLSSHSGSSGFSSTDIPTDSQLGRANSSHGACGNGHYQESTEIIQSLENLNTEIREIWEVLNKQHKEGATRQAVPPPPSLVYPDMGWPMVMGPRAASTTLGERVQALRHQAQQNLSAMGQFSSLPVAALGPNGANQLAQLGAALAHPGGVAQYGATVLGQGASVTDPSLVERTRSLRDWLRQARIESADLISPGQATL